MKITHDPVTGFILKCKFEDRDLARKSGFYWNPDNKTWFTYDVRNAARLRDHCDESAKTQIDKASLQVTPWVGPVLYPTTLTGDKPFDFQIAAAKFALGRNKSYLALDPGLGKTLSFITVMMNLRARAVYICPPFLMLNVEEEFKKWLPQVRVVKFPKLADVKPDTDVMLVPDSMLTRPHLMDAIKAFVSNTSPTILAIDEAHRFKNDEAKRTKALFGDKRKKLEGITSLFRRVVCLSGTPMPNARPMELYPVLSGLVPNVIDFLSRHIFGVRYCAAFETEFGWDYTGASRMEDFAARVKGQFLLRMKKKDVISLPPRLEQMVMLASDLPPALMKLDREMLKIYSPEDGSGVVSDDYHISTYRRELGVEKVDSSVKFIESILEETTEAVLIFAHHKEVITALAQRLIAYDPLVITGAVASGLRQEIANEFQTTLTRRVLILQLQAGGVGFNLTKASRIVFVEFSWVPAENSQAIDRAHRIGQGETVLAQYLTYRNSLDRRVLESNFRKNKTNRHI